ncbi:hypothetical protein [Luteibacter sp.]|jgi:hypothetical protein|uniref:hypothetical protein n=1 Tax=Luteibacter sp. TaxID=1886636 RepID=UPI002F4202F6
MKRLKDQFSKSMTDVTSKAATSKLASLFNRNRHRPQPSQDLGSLDTPDALQRRPSTSSVESIGSMAFAPPPKDYRPVGSAPAKPSSAEAPSTSPEAKRAENVRKNQARLAEKAMLKTDTFGGPRRAPAKSLDRMSISSVISDLPAEQKRTVSKDKGKERARDPLRKANTVGMEGGKSQRPKPPSAALTPDPNTFTSLAAGRDMKALMSSLKQQSEGQQHQYDSLLAKKKALKPSRSAPSLKNESAKGNAASGSSSRGKTGKGKAKQSGQAVE